MKILVIAGRYGLSGVPLAQLKLAKALARDGHQIELIYGAVNEGNKLPESNLFKISTLNSQRVSSMLFPLVKYFISKKAGLGVYCRRSFKCNCFNCIYHFDIFCKNILLFKSDAI